MIWMKSPLALLGNQVEGVSERCTVVSASALTSRSSTNSSIPFLSHPLLNALGLESKDVRAHIPHDVVECVDRFVHPLPRPIRITLEQRHRTLDREPHRIDRLDDPIVQILGDAIPLLEDGEALSASLQLLDQSRVVDGDPSLRSQRESYTLVILREASQALVSR